MQVTTRRQRDQLDCKTAPVTGLKFYKDGIAVLQRQRVVGKHPQGLTDTREPLLHLSVDHHLTAGWVFCVWDFFFSSSFSVDLGSGLLKIDV